MALPTSLNIPSHMIAHDCIRMPCRVNASGGAPRFILPVPLALLDDPSTKVLVQRELSGDGYDRAERQLLDRYLRPGDMFIDIGAHWGLYSLHAVTAAENIQAIAVEPDPENLRYLRYAIAENKLGEKIDVVAGAATSDAGNVWLRPNTAMGHHVYADQGKAGASAFEVEGVTVDGVLEACDIRPVWLKIDVEGREYNVLKGAIELIQSGRLRGVFWESHVAETLANPDMGNILTLLESNGFATFEINKTNRVSIAGDGDFPDLPQVSQEAAD